MEESHQNKNCEEKETLLCGNGKIYFGKNTEREFFFVMTVIMLLLGVLAKLGLF